MKKRFMCLGLMVGLAFYAGAADTLVALDSAARVNGWPFSVTFSTSFDSLTAARYCLAISTPADVNRRSFIWHDPFL